jgi:hypothetical protein
MLLKARDCSLSVQPWFFSVGGFKEWVDGWVEEWLDGWMGGWVGLRVGFININDMYNNDVGKGGAQGCEAYEVK